MDKSVRCLALELPEAVHDDVAKRWQNVKEGLSKIIQSSEDQRKLKCSDAEILTDLLRQLRE